MLNNLIPEQDIFAKYAKNYKILFYDRENLIQKANIEDFECPICLNVLKDPMSCSDNKNSHSFCKECIERYKHENNNNCPTCKQIFQNKITICIWGFPTLEIQNYS